MNVSLHGGCAVRVGCHGPVVFFHINTLHLVDEVVFVFLVEACKDVAALFVEL